MYRRIDKLRHDACTATPVGHQLPDERSSVISTVVIAKGKVSATRKIRTTGVPPSAVIGSSSRVFASHRECHATVLNPMGGSIEVLKLGEALSDVIPCPLIEPVRINLLDIATEGRKRGVARRKGLRRRCMVHRREFPQKIHRNH